MALVFYLIIKFLLDTSTRLVLLLCFKSSPPLLLCFIFLLIFQLLLTKLPSSFPNDPTKLKKNAPSRRRNGNWGILDDL